MTMSKFVHSFLLMNISFTLSVCLLWIKLIRIFLFFCEHICFLQGKNLVVTARSQGRCIYNFVRNYLFSKLAVFYILHQQFFSVLVVSHPCQHWVGVRFFILAILMSVQWHLIVLTFISQMTNNVEYLFLGLLAIPESSLSAPVFHLLFKMVWFIVYYLYILWIYSLPGVYYEYFLQVGDLPFNFL